MKIKDLAQMIGLAAALGGTFPSGNAPVKVGFKKSIIPTKDYAIRKKRLRISGKSRNINHRLN